MTTEFHHTTVLLHETVDLLDIKPDGIYVDATLGGAGHSAYLLSKLSEKGHLYCFDQDQKAIDNAQIRLKDYIDKGMVTFIKDNFRHLKSNLAQHGVEKIDGILYDLGVSSPQLDERERGFSYKQDAALDMRMNQDQALSAYQVVNDYDYQDLVRIFFKYGEDKFSKQIARKIEQARQIKPIETTTELAEIIKSAKPAKELKKKGHPAKQIFQAIRIEVNDELGAADESIQQAIDLLALDGRISVITFHSLEDRLTKQLFKEASTVHVPKGLPFIPDDLKAPLELVNRKPILPSEQELAANNRAHSAKLRVAKKVHQPWHDLIETLFLREEAIMLEDKRRDLTMQVIEDKIKTFTRVEKAFYGSIVLSGLVLAIGIIFMQTKLLQVQSDMASVNQDISVKKLEIEDARQAVNDLVRNARLLEIAEKAGLTLNNDNIGVAE